MIFTVLKNLFFLEIGGVIVAQADRFPGVAAVVFESDLFFAFNGKEVSCFGYRADFQVCLSVPSALCGCEQPVRTSAKANTADAKAFFITRSSLKTFSEYKTG